MQALPFRSASIFRPGLLDRGEAARPLERFAAFVLPSQPVECVARAMIRDAEARIGALRVGNTTGGSVAAGAGTGLPASFRILDNSDITALARQLTPPVSTLK